MKEIKKTTQLYEGKAKKVYSTNDPNYVIVSYKDDATALAGKLASMQRGWERRHQQQNVELSLQYLGGKRDSNALR